MKPNYMLLILLMLQALPAGSDDLIKLDIIRQIESSGNPLAFNARSQARGMYQITPICLRDYNNYYASPYTPAALFNPAVNEIIARWYLLVRIPQLLRHYSQPVTIDNILIGYNAGIGRVGRELPQETENYIAKYKKLEGKK